MQKLRTPRHGRLPELLASAISLLLAVLIPWTCTGFVPVRCSC